MSTFITDPGFAEPQTVIIHKIITSNDPGNADETIDGKGHFLIPGLIDAHVHLHHIGHLQQLAAYGVTTLDMAMWLADKMNKSKREIRSVRYQKRSTARHICMLPGCD
jgi:predicted amidohydrolase YtcJ